MNIQTSHAVFETAFNVIVKPFKFGRHESITINNQVVKAKSQINTWNFAVRYFLKNDDREYYGVVKKLSSIDRMIILQGGGEVRRIEWMELDRTNRFKAPCLQSEAEKHITGSDWCSVDEVLPGLGKIVEVRKTDGCYTWEAKSAFCGSLFSCELFGKGRIIEWRLIKEDAEPFALTH